MGSIIHINRRPQTWIVIDEHKKLTEKYGSEPIVKVRYGTFDDDPDGIVNLKMYMRRNIYENLLANKYNILRSCGQNLRVLDENNNVIEPLVDGIIY